MAVNVAVGRAVKVEVGIAVTVDVGMAVLVGVAVGEGGTGVAVAAGLRGAT
jgi:hypothetical protein